MNRVQQQIYLSKMATSIRAAKHLLRLRSLCKQADRLLPGIPTPPPGSPKPSSRDSELRNPVTVYSPQPLPRDFKWDTPPHPVFYNDGEYTPPPRDLSNTPHNIRDNIIRPTSEAYIPMPVPPNMPKYNPDFDPRPLPYGYDERRVLPPRSTTPSGATTPEPKYRRERIIPSMRVRVPSSGLGPIPNSSPVPSDISPRPGLPDPSYFPRPSIYSE